MVDQTLIEYIKNSRAKGFTDDLIRQTLLSNGWNQNDIEAGFSFVALESNAPKPRLNDGIPVPAPIVANQPPSTQPPPPQATKTTPKTKKPKINSGYSTLLAVALFVFLIILVNKVYSDLNTFLGLTLSAKLIADALMAIPFLVAAFSLHYSFGQNQERFKILSQPYYIASGWPILRLLGNVAQYLFDTSSTYGVYFALILIVVTLTAVIFIVQKFLKKKS